MLVQTPPDTSNSLLHFTITSVDMGISLHMQVIFWTSINLTHIYKTETHYLVRRCDHIARILDHLKMPVH